MNSQIRDKPDLIFKIVIIGNANCGKSSLLNYFITKKGSILFKFQTLVKKNPAQTVGVEFASKSIEVRQKNIKLQLWDTAGQERYRSVARTYYRGTIAAIVVCDVTNNDSFNSLQQWINDAREYGRQDINILICANKIDLVQNRQVSSFSLQQLGNQEKISILETSAQTGENVEESFIKLTEQILEKMDKGDIDELESKPRLLNPLNQTVKIKNEPLDQEKIKNQQKQQCYYC